MGIEGAAAPLNGCKRTSMAKCKNKGIMGGGGLIETDFIGELRLNKFTYTHRNPHLLTHVVFMEEGREE